MEHPFGSGWVNFSGRCIAGFYGSGGYDGIQRVIVSVPENDCDCPWFGFMH
jgi:hypothetical protein